MKRRGNGEGTVQRISTHNYKAIAVVGWKDADHPIRRTKAGFRTAREAREYIPILKGEKPNSRCIADYWDTIWEQVSRLDDATQRKYRLAYERAESIVHQPIDSITIQQLNALVKGLSSNSAVSIKNLLSKAYKLAMAEQVVAVNLALLMTLPTEHDDNPKTPFAKGEIDILWSAWEAEKERVLGMVLLATYTGMMTTECCRVCVTHCDLEHGIIIGCGAKTEKRKQSPIIVPDIVVPIMQWLCDHAVNGSLLALTEKQYRIAFKKCMDRVGIPTAHTPYDCRHTTATMYAEMLEPNTLTEVMRHSTLQMTQHYKHNRAEDIREQVNKALLIT